MTHCTLPIFRLLSQLSHVRFIAFVLLSLGALMTSPLGWAQIVPGSMDVHWNEGAANCSNTTQPPLQVHQYNTQTFILRQNLCATFEAPFMYLLIGSTRALLIDTGNIPDATQMPLAKTVVNLLPENGASKLSLLVVHTHRHLDHRAGDGQFAQLKNTQVVGFELDAVRRYYNFTDWPNGLAQIDLGNRTVDVIPTPGHNETEVSFYDRRTGLFFSGDFLLPGRLLIEDTKAEIASADRLAAFVRDRPVSFVLGSHIELNSAGDTFPWGSQYHPQEHVLQMTKKDLLALPEVVRSFNGFYLVSGKFTLMNSMRILILWAVLAGLVITAFVWILVRYIRRRKRSSRLRAGAEA